MEIAYPNEISPNNINLSLKKWASRIFKSQNCLPLLKDPCRLERCNSSIPNIANAKLPNPFAKSILILVAIVATIFALGLIVGTHLFGSPPESSKNGIASSSTSSLKNADSSPLAAATSKIAASDVQKLIMESAAAEVIEEEEHRKEEEALKNGDVKLALHLRGHLAPGDPNYNPHHHIDDVLQDTDDPLNNNQEIVGGQDLGGVRLENDADKEKKETIVDNMHDQFAQAELDHLTARHA